MSTAYHEGQHLLQGRAQLSGTSGTQLAAMNEVQAYAAELSIANTLSLSPEQVTDLQGLWLWQFNQLGTSNQQRVLDGYYTPAP